MRVICGIVPTKPISDENEDLYRKILCDANAVLVRIKESYGKISFRRFCREFFSGKIKANLSANDTLALNKMKEIQTEIVASNVKAALNIAKRTAHYLGGVSDEDTLNDLVEEALVGLVYATYTYSRLDIKINTWCWRVMTTHMQDYYQTVRSISTAGENDREMVAQIWDYIISQPHKVTLDEACRKLGIKYEDAEIAMRITKKIVSMDLGAGSSTDKAAKRKEIEPMTFDSMPVDSELAEAYRSADLTEMEKAVVENHLLPYPGWKTAVAKQFINPQTGKHYTSWSLEHIWKRAISKIREQYSLILSRKRAEAA